MIQFSLYSLDGQAIATKVSKQITQRTNSLKVAVEKYNAALAAWKDRVNGLPEELDFDTMKDPESEVFQDFRGNISSVSENQVPFSVRRNVIDLRNFIERCKEELSHLDVETLRLFHYHVAEKSRFEELVREYSGNTLAYFGEINCILEKRKHEAENRLYAIGSIFGDRLSVEMISTIPQVECKFVSTETTTETFEKELVELNQGEDVHDDDEQPDDDIVLILESSDEENDDGIEDEDETELNMDL